MSNKISIIVPTRTRARLLRQALRSVRAQTWTERDVVVVDEASADGSAAMLASEFPEARVVRHEVAKGPAAARNAGVAATDGDWVFFWDDDDLMHPAHLEALLHAALAAPPRSLVSGRLRSFAIVDDEIRLAPVVCTPESRPGIETIVEFLQPHRRGTLTLSTILWPRRLLETLSWDEDLLINEDVDFFGRAILAGWQIVGRPVGMNYIRQHDGERASADPTARALLSPARYRLKWSALLAAHPGREVCAPAMRDGFMAQLIDLTGRPEAEAVMPLLREAFGLWGGRHLYVTPPPRQWLKRTLAQGVLDVGGLPALRWLLTEASRLRGGADLQPSRLHAPLSDADKSDAAVIRAVQ
ncbi:MAG: hypothetical protein A3D94_18075 [Alphaproteobacteria bacterium RIFCSPHIGHO2_12_FULL_66_14]|nr:MAG: hypothetical protein A3D94_18075 [Alphaproteobacteria bacterium RIFCSPHIGHO2_12_FULL_66_14]